MPHLRLEDTLCGMQKRISELKFKVKVTRRMFQSWKMPSTYGRIRHLPDKGWQDTDTDADDHGGHSSSEYEDIEEEVHTGW